MDQTPLKYVTAMNHTMGKRNSKSVAIAGSTDKRSITGTFVITLDGRFLPMQLIYGGKTQQTFLDSTFPTVSHLVAIRNILVTRKSQLKLSRKSCYLT